MNMNLNVNELDRKYVHSVAIFAEKSGDLVLGYRVGVNLTTTRKGDKLEQICHYGLFRTFEDAMKLKVKVLESNKINLDYWFWHQTDDTKWYFIRTQPKVRLNSKYTK